MLKSLNTKLTGLALFFCFFGSAHATPTNWKLSEIKKQTEIRLDLAQNDPPKLSCDQPFPYADLDRDGKIDLCCREEGGGGGGPIFCCELSAGGGGGGPIFCFEP